MTEERSEQWKPVKGYEEMYAVSNLGRVKSLERTCKCRGGGVRRVRERILKPALGGKEGYEYFYVTLHKNGATKPFGVHVLVALAFPEICGLPFEGAQCNHIDENPLNNVPSNLNWLSRPDNINHGTGNERRAKAMKGKFINRSDQSKTVYQYTTTTHELVKEWASTHEVERQTGWLQQTISQCCNNRYNLNGTGEHNVYKGYRWSYTRL